MSVHAISWVLRHSEARLGERLVLIVLADHADSYGGQSYPSVATIAAEARMSERAVQYALRALERAGEIARVGTSRWSTVVWQIVGMATANQGGADSAGVQYPTESVPDSAPKPSFKPSRQTTTTTSPVARDEAVEVGDSFEDFKKPSAVMGSALGKLRGAA
jgi:hypothetical protein